MTDLMVYLCGGLRLFYCIFFPFSLFPFFPFTLFTHHSKNEVMKGYLLLESPMVELLGQILVVLYVILFSICVYSMQGVHT